MIAATIAIDCARIRDWPSFHEEFKTVFGFPEFYGRNMAAWIDCVTSLDAPEEGMSKVHCVAGSVLTLALQNVKQFREQSSELYAAIVECSAFVNWRRIESAGTAVLALSFWTNQ